MKKSLVYIAKQADSGALRFASSNVTRQNLAAWVRLKELYDEGKGGAYGKPTTVKKMSEVWLWVFEKYVNLSLSWRNFRSHEVPIFFLFCFPLFDKKSEH